MSDEPNNSTVPLFVSEPISDVSVVVNFALLELFVSLVIVFVSLRVTVPSLVNVPIVALVFDVTIPSASLLKVVILSAPSNNAVPLFVKMLNSFVPSEVKLPLFVRLDKTLESVISISSALVTSFCAAFVLALTITVSSDTLPSSFLIAVVLSVNTTLLNSAVASALFDWNAVEPPEIVTLFASNVVTLCKSKPEYLMSSPDKSITFSEGLFVAPLTVNLPAPVSPRSISSLTGTGFLNS